MTDFDRLKVELLRAFHVMRRRNDIVIEEAVKVYLADIAELGLDYGACASAVVELRRTAEWFPTIAEIREAVEGSSKLRAVTEAEEQWPLVKKGVMGYSRHEHDKTLQIAEDRVNELASLCVRRMGGWVHLGNGADGDLERFHHRAFVKAYSELRQDAPAMKNALESVGQMKRALLGVHSQSGPKSARELLGGGAP